LLLARLDWEHAKKEKEFEFVFADRQVLNIYTLHDFKKIVTDF